MAIPMPSAMRRAEARVGSVLVDKWRLDKLLGVGGMAAVYSATHRNKKRAAIKLLHPEVSLDLAVRERFLREGYVANSVGHSGAVAVDDDDVAEDGSAFLVMELLDGETIEGRWQRKGGLLSAQEVLSIADQVLETLAIAHRKGIVHRDIKPENLFLSRDGSVKILDFGIARVLEWKNARVSATQTGSTMGTPAYMAPEQARGRWGEVDPRTDLWALGATMYTLLTGEFVHGSGTVNEMLALAVTRPARKITTLRPDLHPTLAELVDKALAYKKTDRWADAQSMQNAVRIAYALIEGHDLQSAPQLSLPEASHSPAQRASFDSFADQATLTTARGLASADMPTVTSMNMRRARQWGIVALAAIAVSLIAAVAMLALRSSAVASKEGAPAANAAKAESGEQPRREPVSAPKPGAEGPSVEPKAVALRPSASAEGVSTDEASSGVKSKTMAGTGASAQAASASAPASNLKKPATLAAPRRATPTTTTQAAPKKAVDPFARRR